MTNHDLATWCDDQADKDRERVKLCDARGNAEQAAYNLGRVESLRWVAEVLRRGELP